MVWFGIILLYWPFPSPCCCLQEIKDWHRPRMECLVEEGVDFICIETIAARVRYLVVTELPLRCQCELSLN